MDAIQTKAELERFLELTGHTTHFFNEEGK